jgi:hypothetical protein
MKRRARGLQECSQYHSLDGLEFGLPRAECKYICSGIRITRLKVSRRALSPSLAVGGECPSIVRESWRGNVQGIPSAPLRLRGLDTTPARPKPLTIGDGARSIGQRPRSLDICVATASGVANLPWVFHKLARIIKARERTVLASCEPCRCKISPHFRTSQDTLSYPAELICYLTLLLSRTFSSCSEHSDATTSPFSPLGQSSKRRTQLTGRLVCGFCVCRRL